MYTIKNELFLQFYMWRTQKHEHIHDNEFFFLLSRLEFCTAVVSSFQTAPSPFDSVGRCVSFSAFYCCIQYTYQHVFGPFVQVAGASELVCSIATLMINAATYA